jgi:hypothetical protein
MPQFCVVRACMQCIATTLASLAPGHAEVERLWRLVRTDELWTPPTAGSSGSSGEHALSIRYRPPSRWRSPTSAAALVSLLLTAVVNWAVQHYAEPEAPPDGTQFEVGGE